MPENSFRVEPFPNGQSLRSLLQVPRVPLHQGPPGSAQLEYLERYVQDLGCTSLLIESHYIDRDYIEDFSLFYSRSLHPYENHCRRIHFFRMPHEDLLEAVLNPSNPSWPELTDEDPSNSPYLGFSVVRPLPGAPVGRTILRTYKTRPVGRTAETREFPATRIYDVHLGLRRLRVRGLPFQQQDVGVSACATTAMWVALSQLRAFEDFGSPTPAQITTLATRFSLPFGRALPSEEGLSLDQMCQALQALHVSPSLLVAATAERTVGYLHYALKSGFCPILILENANNTDIRHAVAVSVVVSIPPTVQGGCV